MFTFEPTKITKQLLLNHRSEEEYMSFYLGIIPDDGLHCNPLREDKNPTASFYRANNGDLIFKDWKLGMHENFIGIVMYKFGVPFGKALKIIANDFGIIQKPHYVKNEAAVAYDGGTVTNKGKTSIQVEIKEFTEEELEWWDSSGISQPTLKKFEVYSIKHVFLNGVYMCTSSPTNPIYGYYLGKDNGRELWKLYFPFKKSFRFLLNTDKIQGAKQLPESGEYVVVTKSMKDVMALYELGVPAIAPQAESVILTDRQYAALSKRFKIVIFNGDWDRAGQRFMFESRRRFKCIALSFTNKTKFAKDISDFIRDHGFLKARTLVDKLTKIVLSGRLDYQYKYCKPN